MEIVNRYEFPHLHDWQMKLATDAAQKKQDRELEEQFGRIEDQEFEQMLEDEEEQIFKLEQLRIK